MIMLLAGRQIVGDTYVSQLGVPLVKYEINANPPVFVFKIGSQNAFVEFVVINALKGLEALEIQING